MNTTTTFTEKSTMVATVGDGSDTDSPRSKVSHQIVPHENRWLTSCQSQDTIVYRGDSVNTESAVIDESSHLKGWRLNLAFLSLCLGLIMSQMDITIVSTALVSITDELHDFSKSSWIVTAYLLAYTSFLIPLAKMSDIYGRLPVLIFSLVLFVAFSAGCAWSQNMTQLSLFRALQGIGGGGLFDLAFAMLPQLVPPEKLISWSPMVSGSFLVSACLGPIVGGLVTQHTTWRWIFWINLPVGALIFILSCLAIPRKFPHQNKKVPPNVGLHSLRRIDFAGNFLVLAATTLLIASLETGGVMFEWNNPIPITLLCFGIACSVSCVLWQWFQSKRVTVQEPVLPWRILTDRFAMGLILNCFFVGTTLLGVATIMPMRFQVVDGQDPFGAGIRLIALMGASAVGNVIGAQLVRRTNMAPLYILQLGAVLQTIGTAVYTAVDAGLPGLRASVYGFEVIIGVGMGISLSSTTVLVPKLFPKKDIAVIMGARGQFRLLGGAIAISGCANVLNRTIERHLAGLLAPEQLASILRDAGAASSLAGPIRAAFVDAFTSGFRDQMILLTALSAMTIVANMLLIGRQSQTVPGTRS